MLRLAWNAYRGWAKRARELQAAAERWNLLALVCVVIAAVCGAATALVPAAPSPWNVAGTWLASAAAVAAAIGAYFGREIVGSGKEAGWIQARATAEGLKSECLHGESRRLRRLRGRSRQSFPEAHRRVRQAGDRQEPHARRRPHPRIGRQARARRSDDEGLVQNQQDRRADRLLPQGAKHERSDGRPPVVGGVPLRRRRSSSAWPAPGRTRSPPGSAP